mmetsp:Transcript_17811/g.42064  ORF Transcript_17811/g.42064 Transcript_17811/m.42064 type:complete len:357 (-) Transcript_17811:294-1364(-)
MRAIPSPSFPLSAMVVSILILILLAPPSLAAAEDEQRRPLDPKAVAKAIAKRLWERGVPKTSFFIAGSYPASVKMYEHDGTFLPYNDIDVFVGLSDPEEDAGCPEHYSDDATYSIAETTAEYLDGPTGDTPINIITLCHLTDPVRWGDINGISAGFEVSASALPFHSPKISWTVDESFSKFLRTKVLHIRDSALDSKHADHLKFVGGGNLVETQDFYPQYVIRLLHKAQTLNVEHVLPSEDKLKEIMTGKSLSPEFMFKFQSLPDFMKADVEALFDFYEVKTRFSLWYLITDKGVSPRDDVATVKRADTAAVTSPRRLKAKGSFNPPCSYSSPKSSKACKSAKKAKGTRRRFTRVF